MPGKRIVGPDWVPPPNDRATPTSAIGRFRSSPPPPSAPPLAGNRPVAGGPSATGTGPIHWREAASKPYSHWMGIGPGSGNGPHRPGGQPLGPYRPHSYTDILGNTVSYDATGQKTVRTRNGTPLTSAQYKSVLAGGHGTLANEPETKEQQADTVIRGIEGIPGVVGHAVNTVIAQHLIDLSNGPSGRDVDPRALAIAKAYVKADPLNAQAKRFAEGAAPYGTGPRIGAALDALRRGDTATARKIVNGLPSEVRTYIHRTPILAGLDTLALAAPVAGAAGKIAGGLGKASEGLTALADSAEAAGAANRATVLRGGATMASAGQKGMQVVAHVGHSVATLKPITKPVGAVVKRVARSVEGTLQQRAGAPKPVAPAVLLSGHYGNVAPPVFR